MLHAQHILFFFGEIIRREIGANFTPVSRVDVRRIIIRIGAVQAAQCQSAEPSAALRRQEFAAGKRADEGGVGVEEAVVQPAGQAAQHAGGIGLAQLLLQTGAIVIFPEIIGHGVDRGVFGRLPADAAADGIKVAAVNTGVVEHVGAEAVALQIGASHAHGQRVGDRQVEHALEAQRVVIAILGFASGMDAVQLRLGVDEVDHAAGGVAAEQRALRAAQHFDALQIEEFGFEQAGGEQRHAFGVDGRGAIAGHAHAKIADPADGEAGTGEVALGEGDVGQRQLDVERVVDLLTLQRAGVERGHRDRHVLQALCGALRGHHDFGNAGIFISLCGLCKGWQGNKADKRRAGNKTGTESRRDLHQFSSPKSQVAEPFLRLLRPGPYALQSHCLNSACCNHQFGQAAPALSSHVVAVRPSARLAVALMQQVARLAGSAPALPDRAAHWHDGGNAAFPARTCADRIAARAQLAGAFGLIVKSLIE